MSFAVLFTIPQISDKERVWSITTWHGTLSSSKPECKDFSQRWDNLNRLAACVHHLGKNKTNYAQSPDAFVFMYYQPASYGPAQVSVPKSERPLSRLRCGEHKGQNSLVRRVSPGEGWPPHRHGADPGQEGAGGV